MHINGQLHNSNQANCWLPNAALPWLTPRQMHYYTFRIINLGQDQDTVALEDAFGLKGVPPSSDNTSAGMERHFPGVEQHHFSLSILIYQCSVWKGPDECHSLSSSRAHSKLTVCFSVRLSPGGHFMLGGHKEKPLCATLQEQRHWNILFK